MVNQNQDTICAYPIGGMEILPASGLFFARTNQFIPFNSLTVPESPCVIEENTLPRYVSYCPFRIDRFATNLWLRIYIFGIVNLGFPHHFSFEIELKYII